MGWEWDPERATVSYVPTRGRGTFMLSLHRFPLGLFAGTLGRQDHLSLGDPLNGRGVVAEEEIPAVGGDLGERSPGLSQREGLDVSDHDVHAGRVDDAIDG